MYWIIAGFFGLCFGSFANVLIARLPINKSVISPPSACPKCSNRLKWYHNIPVISYIFLRGKCGFCGTKISIIYPLIELCGGILFLIAFWQLGFTIFAMCAAISFVCILSLAMIDLKYMSVPDSLNFAALIFALFSSPLIIDNLINALILAGGLSLLRMALSSALGKEAMGEGDIILGASMGALLGLQGAFLALFFASFFAIIPSLIRRKNGQKETTFIPFLALGVLFVFCLYDQLIKLLGW